MVRIRPGASSNILEYWGKSVAIPHGTACMQVSFRVTFHHFCATAVLVCCIPARTYAPAAGWSYRVFDAPGGSSEAWE